MMCIPLNPVYDFTNVIMNKIVSNESFEKELNDFKEKGYIIHYGKISKAEYESPNFEEYAKKIIKKAKDESNGFVYDGSVLFYPFVSKQEAKNIINSDIKTFWLNSCHKISGLCISHNDNLCIFRTVFNPNLESCSDTNMHLMVFYHESGLKWE